MTDDIEDAVRSAVRLEASPLPLTEVACLLHMPACTVLHRAADGCPLCLGPNPGAVLAAVHALATAPAPFNEVREALRCIAPFTAQLGTGSISAAFGQTVQNVIELGRSEEGLRRWLNQEKP